MERMRLETKRGYIVAEKYKDREYSPEDIQTIVLDNLVGSIRVNTNGYELYIYEVSELDNSYFFIKTIRLENDNKVSLEDMALKILIHDYNESCWI